MLDDAVAVNLLKMIDSDRSINLDANVPSYEIRLLGEKGNNLDRVQLSELNTYANARTAIDNALNIKKSNRSESSKVGCLYVIGGYKLSGNTCLVDALRNKAFYRKYWTSNEVRKELMKAATQAYTDVTGVDNNSLMAAINAYYDLMQDYIDPDSFNGTSSLTREEFYALVYKSEHGVEELELDEFFADAVGGETELTIYAQEVDEYGFLSVLNKSLDEVGFKGSITRAEAIFLLINKHFPDELEMVTGKESAYEDTKNAGDLALSLKFKYEDSNGNIIGKDRWQLVEEGYIKQEDLDKYYSIKDQLKQLEKPSKPESNKGGKYIGPGKNYEDMTEEEKQALIEGMRRLTGDPDWTPAELEVYKGDLHIGDTTHVTDWGAGE